MVALFLVTSPAVRESTWNLYVPVAFVPVSTFVLVNRLYVLVPVTSDLPVRVIYELSGTDDGGSSVVIVRLASEAVTSSFIISMAPVNLKRGMAVTSSGRVVVDVSVSFVALIWIWYVPKFDGGVSMALKLP